MQYVRLKLFFVVIFFSVLFDVKGYAVLSEYINGMC